MDFDRGYRLRVSGLGELTKLLGAYRTHALRIMAASYAEQIARTAVSALDASCVGLAQNKGDLLLHARDSVAAAHDKVTDGIYARGLNCHIEFHFVGPAILAVMTHGAERFRRPWESRREVVKWGWSAKAQKPGHIGDEAWRDRARFWAEAGKTSAAGFGVFRFILLEEKLPVLGWNAVGRCIPEMEWRVEQCIRKLAVAGGLDPSNLSEKDRRKFEERVRSAISPKIDEASFSKGMVAAKPTPGSQVQTPPKSHEKPAKEARKPPRPQQMASIVDHADIVVAGDGRAFMAVPYVGFRAEDRVFIQVGSKDITFMQNGIQYGSVANIPAASRDYLRGLTSITVVEIIESDGKRLLRAKHTAMVSDISLGEGLRRPLQTFRRRSRDTGIQEI
ncbi:hypothetical protein GOB57_08865 [Sinorhizobium meliloti]|nr:hypothetical protein [Sinorhizobium meliloti]